MSFLEWTALTSVVLLLVALASSFLRDLPITTSVLYLGLGLVIGPIGFGLVSLDVIAAASYVERITEVAVVVALFIGGLKLRLPWRDPAWYAAFALAGPVMVLSILGVALVAHLGLGMPVAAAMLLGAVLAPTDPVLAGAVSVNDAADHDRMRYGLSGEAGLNDGMAFPFIVLALAWGLHGGAGSWLFGWAGLRVLWAVPAGVAIGLILGKLVGRIAIALRTHQRDVTAPSDLLALALMGVAYVSAEMVSAWGFLAVFAAGLGLRAAEVEVVIETPHPDADAQDVTQEGVIPHPPAEALVAAPVPAQELARPAVAAGVLVSETLSFGDTVERLLEAGLIVAVGVALGTHWDARALVIALALFVVVRPLATRLALAFTPTTALQRWLMGWFGIRGVASVYYLGYALRHGVPGDTAEDLVGLTVSVIALSIVIHGITAQPLLSRYERSLEDAEDHVATGSVPRARKRSPGGP